MTKEIVEDRPDRQTGSGQNRMGTHPIFPLIVKMSLPAMFSMLIQALYNIVDSIYVSRLGEEALSAVSLIYPVQLMSVALGVGTGAGLSSLISRRLGEERQEEADQTATHGLFLPVFGMNQGLLPVLGYNYGARNKVRLQRAFSIGIATALVIMLFGTFVFQTYPREIMSLFRAEGDLMRMGIDALRIISLCYPSAAIGILISTFFQATGHGVYALISSIMRQLVLLFPLAYLLAYTMGLDAVWWAYVISDVASACVSLYLLRRLWKNQIQFM